MVDEDQAFEYDVQLTRLPSDTLRQRYPHMTVRSTAAQTALRRRVDGPAELSALLVEIGTLGLTLTDVHRVASVEDGPAGAGLYELRVLGELGEPSLRYLKCTHYHVEKQALVRLTLVPDELHGFLQACTDCGAGLARVHRVGPPSVERPGSLVGSV